MAHRYYVSILATNAAIASARRRPVSRDPTIYVIDSTIVSIKVVMAIDFGCFPFDYGIRR